MPDIHGKLEIEPEGKKKIKNGAIDGEIDIRATLNAFVPAPGVGRVGLLAFVGGKPTFDIQTIEPFFRHLGFEAFANVALLLGPWLYELNYTFIDVQRGERRDRSPVESVLADNDGDKWELVPTVGRTNYPIVEANPNRRQQAAMRRSVELGDRLATRRPEPANLRRSSAVVTVAENSSPLSRPAFAARQHTNDLMVVLAEDTRPQGDDTSPCQFTRLVWTRFNGSTWSTPRHLDTRRRGAQSEPDVCYDGRGRAIAVWEQIDDPQFDTEDPGEYLRHNDVIASIYDPAENRYHGSFNFGVADRADLQPYSRGPLVNGDAIVLWQRSRVPSFHSKEPQPAINTEFRMVAWDSHSSRWQKEQRVMECPNKVAGFTKL